MRKKVTSKNRFRAMSTTERLRAVAEEAVDEIERLRNALTELRDGDRFGIEAKYFAEHILNGDDR